MQRFGAVLLLVALLLIACSQPFCPPEASLTPGTGRICGVVLDTDTGKPIAYAMVVLIDTNVGTFTKQAGEFKLDDIPPGIYSARVLMPG